MAKKKKEEVEVTVEQKDEDVIKGVKSGDIIVTTPIVEEE